MIPYICLAILMFCVARQHIEDKTYYVAQVVFLVYGVALWSLSFDFGMSLYSANSYAYMSLFNLLVTCLLFYRIGNLAILVMGLNVLSITTNMLGFWLEEVTGSTTLHESVILFLFSIEVCFLLSKRATNGVYRNIGKFGVLCWNLVNGNKNNSSSDKG